MIDSKVRSIVSSLSNARGENFFNTIVLALSQAIDADHTYVAKLSNDYTIATSIAYAQSGDIVENFSYPLKDTPCADVCGDGACFLNGDVQQLYPDDQLLVDMNVNSYVGAPLKDSQGKVLGIIIALYSDIIHKPQDVESLFLLFSGLISGEMERRDNQRRLNIHQTMIDSLDEAVLLTNERIELFTPTQPSPPSVATARRKLWVKTLAICSVQVCTIKPFMRPCGRICLKKEFGLANC